MIIIWKHLLFCATIYVRFVVYIIPSKDALLPSGARIADRENQAGLKRLLQKAQDQFSLLVVW